MRLRPGLCTRVGPHLGLVFVVSSAECAGVKEERSHCMHTIEQVLPVEALHLLRRFRYVLDSLLACAGSLLVTGVIYRGECAR